MIWATWTNTPLVSSIVLCSIVLVLLAVDPQAQAIKLNLIGFLVVVSLVISVAPERITAIVSSLLSFVSTIVNDYHVSELFLSNASMLITSGALFWLLHRAFQTLWRPVPELIDLLGVEVPAPPDVSLTAIGVDKATITWSKPPSNRAVDKYVIQVNGVNVGESATSNDTFITVSGLKPNHFYNVRIIAVGSNNFQAGSRVLRFRTFGADGRPRLGTARLPSEFTDDDAASASRQQDNATGNDDNTLGKQFVTSVFGGAPTSASEGSQALSRDGPSGALPPSRRNTVNRRHSPSTASLDHQQQIPSASGVEDDSGVDEAQMAELNQRYLNLRRETEEVVAQCLKEEEDTKKVLDELEAEKRKKRLEQKKKEEQTKKLTKEQNTTERNMRTALSQRGHLEKKLREKNLELNRLHENIEKWDKSIQEMRAEQESFNQKRAVEDEEYQRQTQQLRESNKEKQAECARLEAELKQVRQAVKVLEEGRNALPTTGDDSERAQIVHLKRALQREEAEHRSALNYEQRRRDALDAHMVALSNQMQAFSVAPSSIANGSYEFDPTVPNHLRNHSHASNPLSSGVVSSPAAAYAPMDMGSLSPSLAPPYAANAANTTSIGNAVNAASAVNSGRPPTQQPFVTGPFMGSSADPPDLDEAGLKALTHGAPLSPSAKSLIPSALFLDDEPDDGFVNGTVDSNSSHGSLDWYSIHNNNNNNNSSNSNSNSSNSNKNSSSSNNDNANQSNVNLSTVPTTDADTTIASGGASGPQSPSSSSQSRSLLSSPRESAQNLSFVPSYSIDNIDGRLPPPSVHASPVNGPAALPDEPHRSARFGLFSFQRSRNPGAVDEEGPALGTLKYGQSQSFPRQGEDAEGSKTRRSGWSMFGRNSGGPDANDGLLPPAGQLNGKTGGSLARSLMPFTSRGSIFAERDAGSPRPSSMASIDISRPSTDSGSIWGPPGESGVSSSALGKSSLLWPADHSWPSRNPSRRQSLHGSLSALRTNLASADDKILNEEELLNPETSPSQVGVIGSKPPAGLKAANKSLNPAAPTFMANIFRPKGDKDKDKDKDKDHKESKSKGKEKAKDKSKGRDKGKGKEKEKDKDTEHGETPAAEGSSANVGGGGSLPNLAVDHSSPSTPRMSREGHSVHTQASVAGSRESLDYVVSNTTSEPNSVSMLSSSKDSDNALLKLFRKDSSVKRSFQRIGRAKGTGSIASSEKNMSVGHRSSFGDYEDLGDEAVLSTSSSRRAGHNMPLTSVGSVDSMASTSSVGPTKSRDSKGDSNIKIKGSGWFSMKKKNRDKDSVDIDRSMERGLASPGAGGGEPDSMASSIASVASVASMASMASVPPPTDDGESKS